MLRNKRGIELSVNFLVTIIIALVIFGFGVRFIYNLSSEATQLKDISVEDLDKRLGELLCDGTDTICIGIDKKVVKRGGVTIFGIKIVNVQSPDTFEIQITRPATSGYTPTNQGIDASQDKLIWKPRSRAVDIGRNEEKEVGFGVEVPKDALAGTYIFDVNVIKQSTGESYGKLHKFYVEVP